MPPDGGEEGELLTHHVSVDSHPKPVEIAPPKTGKTNHDTATGARFESHPLRQMTEPNRDPGSFVKGLDRARELRAGGLIEILELPPTNTGADDYDFESLSPVHVVNCPTPMTLDSAIHRARNLSKRALEGEDR